ncbi:hypothetical protein D1872_286370 [compost metagenome]
MNLLQIQNLSHSLSRTSIYPLMRGENMGRNEQPSASDDLLLNLLWWSVDALRAEIYIFHMAAHPVGEVLHDHKGRKISKHMRLWASGLSNLHLSAQQNNCIPVSNSPTR